MFETLLNNYSEGEDKTRNHGCGPKDEIVQASSLPDCLGSNHLYPPLFGIGVGRGWDGRGWWGGGGGACRPVRFTTRGGRCTNKARLSTLGGQMSGAPLMVVLDLLPISYMT